MNRLFIELYLDEDVDVFVAKLLMAYGFIVVTARDADQLKRILKKFRDHQNGEAL